ncbi:MAG: cytochrome c [Saprospiraceae bacterium]|nr:cytochrome c [Saprospiraceae bacterium]
MKQRTIIQALFFLLLLISMIMSCKTPESITGKSGAVLWSENCQRCHNLPASTMYNDDQWATIGQHMRLRANLTNAELDKVITFLQSSNAD